MKTKFFALAGLAIVAAACNKENVPQVNENGRVTVSFNANTVDTKVVYTEDAAGEYYNINWSENEELGLRFYNPADLTEFSEFYKFTKGDGNKFTGEVEPLEGCDKVNVFACWPYDAEFLPVEGKSDQLRYTPYVNINLEDVKNIYPAGDEEYGHTLLLAAGADREYNKIGSLEFRQMCAILKMNITGVPTGAKVEKITIFTSGDVLPDTSPGGYAGGYSLTSRYRINVNTCELAGVNRCAFLSANVSGTENGQDCIVNFPLLDTKKVMALYNETGDKYRFVVTLSDGSTFEKTLTEKVMFEEGHVYKLNMPLAGKKVKDLSYKGTANCYIVNEYCNCKFDATKKGHTTEPVGEIASTEVLWESFGTSTAPAVGDIVSNVSVENGIVSFTASGKDGNAVIAVKDAAGDILWSWHIWVCKDFDPAASAQVYNNNAGTMMDRNLGATSATKGDVKALGLLYQWGRKDPFLSAESISYSTDYGQAKAKSTITWPSAVSSNASNGTIDFVVKHPTTFVKYGSNNYDWYYTGDSSTDNTRWTSSKGMYDPCPKGWRVPDGGDNGVWAKAFGTSSDWTTSSNWDSTNMGMDFGSTDRSLGSGSIWYPASGYLIGYDGSLYAVSYYGGYWSCMPNGSNVCNLCFYSNGYVRPSSYDYRALGLSVRCLAE